MKKVRLFVAVMTVVALFSASAAVAGPIAIKFAHSGSLEHQYHIAALHFKKLVEERSGGALTVTIFPHGQLGGERDIAEGVRMGTVEMGSVSPGNLTGFVPELHVFGIPYLFKTRAQVYAILDGQIGHDVSGMMEQKGFKNLAFWEVGFRNMTNNVRQVRTPDDMKGLKIRVQESKIKIELMKALGAIPTPIPFGELYTALQQKVVDGQENPIATIYSMKFYEVQKFLSLTGHTYEPASVLANPKWFNGLSAEHQALLETAARETAVYQREVLAEKDKERLEIIRKAGVEVEEHPDIEAFAAATEGLESVFAAELPEGFLDKVKAAIAEVQ